MTSLNGIVRNCLQGSVEAYLALDREMRPRLVVSLQNRGASASMAEEIAADVLGDCCLPAEKSLLNRFSGKREFESWLLRIGINRLIDRQRRQVLFQQDELNNETLEKVFPTTAHPDAILRGIIRKALAESFAACDPQIRVLLWLTYAFKVKQSRLARAWGWSESKLSRTLTSSCDAIRERTLTGINKLDPGLTILWEDVVEVCAERQEAFF